MGILNQPNIINEVKMTHMGIPYGLGFESPFLRDLLLSSRIQKPLSVIQNYEDNLNSIKNMFGSSIEIHSKSMDINTHKRYHTHNVFHDEFITFKEMMLKRKFSNSSIKMILFVDYLQSKDLRRSIVNLISFPEKEFMISKNLSLFILNMSNINIISKFNSKKYPEIISKYFEDNKPSHHFLESVRAMNLFKWIEDHELNTNAKEIINSRFDFSRIVKYTGTPKSEDSYTKKLLDLKVSMAAYGVPLNVRTLKERGGND